LAVSFFLERSEGNRKDFPFFNFQQEFKIGGKRAKSANKKRKQMELRLTTTKQTGPAAEAAAGGGGRRKEGGKRIKEQKREQLLKFILAKWERYDSERVESLHSFETQKLVDAALGLVDAELLAEHPDVRAASLAKMSFDDKFRKLQGGIVLNKNALPDGDVDALFWLMTRIEGDRTGDAQPAVLMMDKETMGPWAASGFFLLVERSRMAGKLTCRCVMFHER
jgi:hypothetical protein